MDNEAGAPRSAIARWLHELIVDMDCGSYGERHDISQSDLEIILKDLRACAEADALAPPEPNEAFEDALIGTVLDGVTPWLDADGEPALRANMGLIRSALRKLPAPPRAEALAPPEGMDLVDRLLARGDADSIEAVEAIREWRDLYEIEKGRAAALARSAPATETEG